MEGHEQSAFWKVMKRHSVDIYFTGESHLITASLDTDSNIVQIVGRGNFFSSLLAVNVSDETIDVTCYKEVGSSLTMSNFNYEESGHLQILSTDGTKSISASGDLSFFDKTDPILHFNFENIVPLIDRPVLGLGELPGVRRAPTVSRVTVDGVSCSESMINAGVFGMDYDAQVANIELVTEGVFGSAGVFNTNSRAAIHGMGPHSGRLPISYALWFKTTTYGPRILLAYKTYWNGRW